jgi:hypothetical protein
MILSEIQSIQNDSESPIAISEVYDLYQYSIVNGYVALKVTGIVNSYDSTNPIEITLAGIVQAHLIFTRDKKVEISVMSELEFISFLIEAEYNDYQLPKYEYKYDYLLIKADFFLEYLDKYEKTSMLWGGFTHELIVGSPTTRYKKAILSIEIGEELKPFDSYSYESCVRAVEQPYAFERFLKLYHLLELQFDYFVIDKIKSLEIPADSNKIGKVLTEYSRTEIDRLTDIISHYCTDFAKLETNLAKVCSFNSIAEDMFINFGKSVKPLHLTNPSNLSAVLSTGSFASSTINGLNPKISGYNINEHGKFITNLTAFWIYRIRCSVAHNKIGEYLLSWNDENFIVEFGEPLLKEVLIQCFKK